jgi:hypothetical protein
MTISSVEIPCRTIWGFGTSCKPTPATPLVIVYPERLAKLPDRVEKRALPATWSLGDRAKMRGAAAVAELDTEEGILRDVGAYHWRWEGFFGAIATKHPWDQGVIATIDDDKRGEGGSECRGSQIFAQMGS